MPALPESNPQRKPNVSFTGAKLDWMTAAAYDRRVKPSDFRVAFVIAQHVNEKTGKGFPSEAWVAEVIGTSVSTVERAVRLLHQTGWLKIRRKRTYDPKSKTWKTQNNYTLRFENVQTMLDLITASRLKRRYFKPVTSDGFKPVTHDGLTPSEKHLQKRRSLPTKGKDKREVGEWVLPVVIVSNGPSDRTEADRTELADVLAQLGDVRKMLNGGGR